MTEDTNMMFRIYRVMKQPDGTWWCHYTCIRGQGAVLTDTNGSGLYLKEWPGALVKLLSPWRFHIPSAFPPALARERFVAALLFLNWGVEMREDGPGGENGDD